MIIKQVAKSLPVAVKGELIGKDVEFKIMFLGRNYIKFKLGQKAFIWLRNFLEDIYQESLDSYQDTATVNQLRVDRNKVGKKSDDKNVDRGYNPMSGMSNISDRNPFVRNGIRVN